MSETTRVYYRIRFPAFAGDWREFYSSRNGTDQWAEISKVKAILSRGMTRGYMGRIRTPFENYEIVKVTEKVTTETEVVDL